MALPIILVNSSTGSDSSASGSGPVTAITGTSAATDATNGKTVTISDAVDLSGVATDGSAAVFINDSTAGHRNFDNITAISGSSGSWTVTVQNGFSLSLAGKTWAIGGKRASVGSASSVKLIENNAASGDAMPGWVIEMQSGHTETITATINTRRAGDTANGTIVLRGTHGAATMPILTFSNNGDALVNRAQYWEYRDFEMQNSNVTKTSSIAFDNPIGSILIQNIRINNATNKFWRGINSSGMTLSVVRDCDIRNTASHAIALSASTAFTEFTNNVIASSGGAGIAWTANLDCTGVRITGNIIAFNAGSGIDTSNMTSSGINASMLIQGNVIHGNGGDGLKVTATSAQDGIFWRLTVQNNEFTLNGGYGINFSGSGITDNVLNAHRVAWRGNAFYANISGKYFPTTLTLSENEVTTDPSGGLASATKDYAGTTGGTNFMSSVHKGAGWPGASLPVGTVSSSTNYADIGLQHQDAGGGSTGPTYYSY